MLTLKHFFDRPSWAAAAGYDFNFIDCMSEAANRINVFQGICQMVADIPHLELREAWYGLPLRIVLIPVALSWPLIFWVFAIHTYLKCKRARNEWLGTNDPVVINNIEVWKARCDRRFG